MTLQFRQHSEGTACFCSDGGEQGCSGLEDPLLRWLCYIAHKMVLASAGSSAKSLGSSPHGCLDSLTAWWPGSRRKKAETARLLFSLFLQNVFLGTVPHSSHAAERASFCKPCFSSYQLTGNSGATNTQNDRFCMANGGGDFTASWASHIPEVGIGSLRQAVLPVFPPLLFWRGMEEILSKRFTVMRRSSPLERPEVSLEVNLKRVAQV